MKKISDKNEAARLKDRISQGYRYFSERGEWTSMDKESMKDLIDAYSQFSQNSFVHSVVEIEMEKWKVIDDWIWLLRAGFGSPYKRKEEGYVW